MGLTTHVSPLRFKIMALETAYPSETASCLEDWLIDVANARGARIVRRPTGSDRQFISPSRRVFSNEELIVAICQPQCLDRPQMLRLAAQLISRGAVKNPRRLKLVAKRERACLVLGELARLAVTVAPNHETWRSLLEAFQDEPRPREPILHWTRLAEPVPGNGRYNAGEWRLVA